jgi:hypothetical protein
MGCSYRSGKQLTCKRDIGESRAHTDQAGQRNTGFGSDVFEFPAAEVLPQFISTKLIGKQNVIPTIAINVGHGNRIAVVVVDGFVGF